jgi:hypothetical protein
LPLKNPAVSLHRFEGIAIVSYDDAVFSAACIYSVPVEGCFEENL